ncbi:competence/damage-inducible protein A [Limosilactobacillus viscerum]|uniref:competence/damage-inducible protein A n=1 Tax=Limosilactobacillus viscerum TaxID=2993450 RepID=UPI0024B9F431|nr:competence/damage-inducible protein A [Limosilactobacillus viscerum]
MDAEIISVGTELALGQVTNTNAPLLAQTLTAMDIKAPYQVTVLDDANQIKDAIHTAQKRAGLIFVCGGLGPTTDDVTLRSTAAALETDLATDDQHWEWIKESFKNRKTELPPENIQQARYLAGGQPLANPVGLALGSWYDNGKQLVVVMPGPPSEFRAMLEKSVKPRLIEKYGTGRQITSRTLNFLGRPESLLMDEIEEATADFTGMTVTSYVQPSQIQVRINVYDLPTEEAKALLDKVTAAILAVERPFYFGMGDKCSLAEVVVDSLKERGLTITGAESLTGGLFQSTICSVPGASNVFDGGFVTYAASAKEKLVGVDKDVIEKYGVVSSPTAAQMAEKSRQQLDADFGVAFTGVAGPDALEGNPAGTVWLGLAQRNQPVQTRELHLAAYNGRQEIRNLSVQYGLQMVYQALQK